MIKLLDSIYERIPDRGLVQRSIRYMIRVSANLLYHFYATSEKKSLNKDTVIVSLTSYPARINSVHTTIKSLLNQTYDNIYIILWLSAQQLDSIKSLPKKLLDLQEKGLEIRIVSDDLRSHKKYFYAFQRFPEHRIITVDDDVIYHPHLVSTLVEFNTKFPNCVICNRCAKIIRGGYSLWRKNDRQGIPQRDILPTGIGGILYPPHSLDERVFSIEAIKTTCLNADDLWLNFMCRLKRTQVVYTGFKTGLITILSTQKTALCNENVTMNKNDIQMEAISKWAQTNMGCDFFVNI